jgi:hypothetical protein
MEAAGYVVGKLGQARNPSTSHTTINCVIALAGFGPGDLVVLSCLTARHTAQLLDKVAMGYQSKPQDRDTFEPSNGTRPPSKGQTVCR